jgi:hypothetical protein
MTDRHSLSNGQGQGMNWIRPVKRLAIYLRDGLACVYCGAGIESETKLTLDHLRPHSQGGSNQETNLVTCCHRCNSARGKRSWKKFAELAANYVNHGRTPAFVIEHIETCRKRPLHLHLIQAASAMKARGNFSGALNHLTTNQES